MGIFKEDLLNFGNLIDTEVEVRLRPEDLAEVFGGLEFELGDGLVKIRGKRRGIILRRGFEFRGAQEEGKVYNIREFKTIDMGVYLRILSDQGIEELEGRGMKREGEYLRVSLLEALKRSDVYKMVPDVFKEKLVIKRYKVREGALSLFLSVTK